jgi:hypothetical protein
MLQVLLALGLAQPDAHWPGLHIATTSPTPPVAPPPPSASDGMFSPGHRCGNPHQPIAMFVDSAAGCHALALEQKHNQLGTIEYFAWSAFTLYCYGCAELEVDSGSLVPDIHYDVYEVYTLPFYDPVAHWAERGPCFDTPGWHNSDFATCATYAERHWCIDGVMEWLDHFGGAPFRYPEQNCCACGGGSSVAPAPSPPPSQHPLPCVDLQLQGMPAPERHMVMLVVPGGAVEGGDGGVVQRWFDPNRKSCSDYAIRGATALATTLARSAPRA